MKIIFSRKGYDSVAGKIPSPIFPDGTMYSLPIPAKQEPKLKDIRCLNKDLGCIVSGLIKNTNARDFGTHLDPDLDREARPRKTGWLPCFGQVGSAQSHLQNQHVNKGDLFLFFGWYRQVTESNGTYSYKTGARDIHCLFGWLQIGEIYRPGTSGSITPDWASDHPHVRYFKYYSSKATNNTLYVASKHLNIPGLQSETSGGGIFRHFRTPLRLSESGNEKSIWRLPDFFYPSKGKPPLSFHSDLRRWHRDELGILLRTVGRGQEFVLDCKYYPEVWPWLRQLFNNL